MLKIYRCPSCQHALEYDGKRDLLVCPQHGAIDAPPGQDPAAGGNTFSVQTVLLMESQGQSFTQGTEVADGSGRVTCPSCGTALLQGNDAYTSALLCPNCGNPVEIESRATGAFQPNWILPFKTSKAEAKERFKKWARKGKLTPSSFKQDATLSAIQGYYVPSWLYTYTLDADLDYTGKKTKKVRQGDVETITEDTFKINLKTRGTYERVPVNADETIDREAMQVLEPYDYKALTDFALPYLSGYRAERYHFTPDKFTEEVQEAIKNDLLDASRDKVTGYDDVDLDDENVLFSGEKAEYALLPVWMLVFRYQQKKFPLYMNGQTGKIYGKLPTSVGKVAILFGSVFSGILLVLFLLGVLL